MGQRFSVEWEYITSKHNIQVFVCLVYFVYYESVYRVHVYVRNKHNIQTIFSLSYIDFEYGFCDFHLKILKHGHSWEY